MTETRNTQKIQKLKLSKTISECCELMTSKKLCMWWTNYNDNNYLFSCFYLNNYSTASAFCWISIYMQTPFFLNMEWKTNIEVRFPIFYATNFTEVNCKSKIGKLAGSGNISISKFYSQLSNLLNDTLNWIVMRLIT